MFYKLQVGSVATAAGNGVTNGTPFRCVIIGTYTTLTANGTATIPNAPTIAGNPIVFASINIQTTENYGVQVNPTGTNTFSYSKWFWGSNILYRPTSESFNYIAIGYKINI